jgi:hypothetical protein
MGDIQFWTLICRDMTQKSFTDLVLYLPLVKCGYRVLDTIWHAPLLIRNNHETSHTPYIKERVVLQKVCNLSYEYRNSWILDLMITKNKKYPVKLITDREALAKGQFIAELKLLRNRNQYQAIRKKLRNDVTIVTIEDVIAVLAEKCTYDQYLIALGTSSCKKFWGNKYVHLEQAGSIALEAGNIDFLKELVSLEYVDISPYIASGLCSPHDHVVDYALFKMDISNINDITYDMIVPSTGPVVTPALKNKMIRRVIMTKNPSLVHNLLLCSYEYMDFLEIVDYVAMITNESERTQLVKDLIVSAEESGHDYLLNQLRVQVHAQYVGLHI